MYGAGIADSNLHAPNGLPLLLVGGGSGTLKGGRHLKYPLDTPQANLHLTLLDTLGVSTVERIGDSTGKGRSPLGRVTGSGLDVTGSGWK